MLHGRVAWGLSQWMIHFWKVAHPLSKGCYMISKKWLTPCQRDVTQLEKSGSPPAQGMLHSSKKWLTPCARGVTHFEIVKKWLTPCARDVTGFRKSVTSFFGSSTWLTPCATGLFRRIGTRDLELLRLEIGLGVVKKLSQRRRKAARG